MLVIVSAAADVKAMTAAWKAQQVVQKQLSGPAFLELLFRCFGLFLSLLWGN